MRFIPFYANLELIPESIEQSDKDLSAIMFA